MPVTADPKRNSGDSKLLLGRFKSSGNRIPLQRCIVFDEDDLGLLGGLLPHMAPYHVISLSPPRLLGEAEIERPRHVPKQLLGRLHENLSQFGGWLAAHELS